MVGSESFPLSKVQTIFFGLSRFLRFLVSVDTLEVCRAGRTVLLPKTRYEGNPTQGEFQTGWGPVRLNGKVCGVWDEPPHRLRRGQSTRSGS